MTEVPDQEDFALRLHPKRQPCLILGSSKIRVKDDWYVDQWRVVVENNGMALLGELLREGRVPKVRYYVLESGWESRWSSTAGRSWSQ